MAEKEKNCRKLVREKELFEHDMYVITSSWLCHHYIAITIPVFHRKYHKGIAPIHFDKTSTDTHVKGCILTHVIHVYIIIHNVAIRF